MPSQFAGHFGGQASERHGRAHRTVLSLQRAEVEVVDDSALTTFDGCEFTVSQGGRRFFGLFVFLIFCNSVGMSAVHKKHMVIVYMHFSKLHLLLRSDQTTNNFGVRFAFRVSQWGFRQPSRKACEVLWLMPMCQSEQRNHRATTAASTFNS